jgi:hypothetical protein
VREATIEYNAIKAGASKKTGQIIPLERMVAMAEPC